MFNVYFGFILILTWYLTDGYSLINKGESLGNNN